MNRVLGLISLLLLLLPTRAAAAPAWTATVEWTIVAPSPPGPARTLLLDVALPGIGPIEHSDCATWNATTHVLTLWDTTAGLRPRGTCYPASKAIRRAGSEAYALTWKEGAGPFFEWLLYPGDRLPVILLPNGGVAVQLP